MQSEARRKAENIAAAMAKDGYENRITGSDTMGIIRVLSARAHGDCVTLTNAIAFDSAKTQTTSFGLSKDDVRFLAALLGLEVR